MLERAPSVLSPAADVVIQDLSETILRNARKAAARGINVQPARANPISSSRKPRIHVYPSTPERISSIRCMNLISASIPTSEHQHSRQEWKAKVGARKRRGPCMSTDNPRVCGDRNRSSSRLIWDWAYGGGSVLGRVTLCDIIEDLP